MSNALYNFHDSSLPGVELNKSAGRKKRERGGKLTMMTVQQMVMATSMPRVMVSGLRGYMMLSSLQ